MPRYAAGLEYIMKVIFDRDKLLAILSPAASIAPGRNTIATIEGILFECPGDEPGTCRITAYDMEKGFRASVDAKIMSEGSFIINSHNILQIVRSMPSGEITVDIESSGRVKITGGNSFFEINSISGDSFPALPLLSGDKNYTLPQHVFKSLVSKTIFAIDPNAQRAILSGVYFCIEEGMLKCVGIDGQRVGYAEVDVDADEPEASFIVPGKILSELMKNVHDTEDEITISVARKHVIFTIGGFVYFSRLIDGEYVNYKRIIPKEFEKTAYVDTEALTKATERAMIVTEDRLGGSNSKTYIKLEFDCPEKLLKISSASTGGSVYEEIPIAMDGESLIIGFNCRYLIEALKACDDADTVCIKMNGQLMGICISPAEGGVEKKKSPVRYTLFIMPLRMTGR